MPNPPISLPDPYDAQRRALVRRQRLADMLKQQELMPAETFKYKGIEAPPSLAGGLAKGLRMYLAYRDPNPRETPFEPYDFWGDPPAPSPYAHM